jgi:hypothetical protein
MQALLTVALLAVGANPNPVEITGQYVEARTCDVWTGPCFANADFNLSGKNAVMAWRVDRGSVGAVKLDGLSVVAVIRASDTLGLEQTGPAKVVLIVDSKATTEQQAALVALAKKQGGALLGNVLAVQTAPIDLTVCECKGETCAVVTAGAARVKTRCLDQAHDRACGNETAFYPPLAQGVHARPAGALENVWNGSGLGLTWGDFDRRGAYVGTFVAR